MDTNLGPSDFYEKDEDLVRFESDLYEHMQSTIQDFQNSQFQESIGGTIYLPSQSKFQKQARMKHLNRNLNAGKNLMKGKILDKMSDTIKR